MFSRLSIFYYFLSKIVDIRERLWFNIISTSKERGCEMKRDNVQNFNLQKLKYERLSRNISAKEVGEALGITGNAYYKKEVGMSNISVEEFAVILDRLGIPTNKAGIFFTFDVPNREQAM